VRLLLISKQILFEVHELQEMYDEMAKVADIDNVLHLGSHAAAALSLSANYQKTLPNGSRKSKLKFLNWVLIPKSYFSVTTVSWKLKNQFVLTLRSVVTFSANSAFLIMLTQKLRMMISTYVADSFDAPLNTDSIYRERITAQFATRLTIMKRTSRS
jgi:hypothetical protein